MRLAAGNNPASMVIKHSRHLIISRGTASGGVLCISFGGSTVPTGLQFFLFPFYCHRSSRRDSHIQRQGSQGSKKTFYLLGSCPSEGECLSQKPPEDFSVHLCGQNHLHLVLEQNWDCMSRKRGRCSLGSSHPSWPLDFLDQ